MQRISNNNLSKTGVVNWPWVTSTKTLVEFRVGRMVKENKYVVPCREKGLLRVVKIGEKLIQARWIDRTTSIIEHVSQKFWSDLTDYFKYFDIPIQKGKVEITWLHQCSTGKLHITI